MSSRAVTQFLSGKTVLYFMGEIISVWKSQVA